MYQMNAVRVVGIGRARYHLRLGLLLLAVGAISISSWRQPTHAREPDVTWISAPARAAFEPAACMGSNGLLWVLWVAQVGAKDSRPAIEGGVLRSGKLLARFRIAKSGELPAVPQIVAHDEGAYCLWEAGSDGERQLVGIELTWNGSAVEQGAREVLPSDAATPLAPSLVSFSDELEVVFQGLNGSNYDIYHARRGESGWTVAEPLAETDVDEWNPRAAVDGSGRVHVVWDFFDGESFDVAYARIKGGELVDRVELAQGADYQGYPEIAVDPRDPDGAAWIAWETASQFGSSGALRGQRMLRLVRLDAKGTTWFDSSKLPKKRRQFPRPFATENGLLVACRIPMRSERQRPRVFASWQTTLLRFEAGSASKETFDATDGSNDVELAFAGGADELWMVFASDGRRRKDFPGVGHWNDSIEGSWRIGVVRIKAPTGFPKLEPNPPAPIGIVARTATPALDPDSARTYFGDLHRHTHLSRCSGARDGTLLDAFRYARGPGGLDFMAVTDHYQHLRPWSWWRSVRDASRYNAPGSLILFAGVERTVTGRGHFNDIYLDPTDIPFDPKTWAQAPGQNAPVPDDEVISIPHMMSVDTQARFDWDEYDEDRTRLFEVYQGLRGSYEGAGLPYEAVSGVVPESSLERGLKRGAHFGLIASSDHASSRAAYAGVHARELTRAAIFEALRERHTFATTERRALSAHLGTLDMGDVGDPGVGAHPSIELLGSAAQDVAYVELVLNGKVARRLSGEGDDETWIITLSKGEGLRVEIDGGRIAKVRPRRPGENRVRVLSESEDSVSFIRVGTEAADIALDLHWDGDGAIELSGNGRRIRITREELEPGRARIVKRPAWTALVWRQGAALGDTSGNIVFEDVRVDPGMSVYMRVAWIDGELAWTSPIRVTSNNR